MAPGHFPYPSDNNISTGVSDTILYGEIKITADMGIN